MMYCRGGLLESSTGSKHLFYALCISFMGVTQSDVIVESAGKARRTGTKKVRLSRPAPHPLSYHDSDPFPRMLLFRVTIPEDLLVLNIVQPSLR